MSILASRTHDLAGAEDALAEAFAEALEACPSAGIPRNPEGWLVTVARRRQIDARRHAQVQAGAEADLALLADTVADGEGGPAFPDERLWLMFVCAHPEIDEDVRAPLMLQTVLGLDAARMAGAFLASPAALSQRLVRAKQKIRDARIPFETPASEDLPARLQDVLDAIYVAYGTSWDECSGADAGVMGLATESLQLADAMAALLPQEPEALGLLALMLFCEARGPARRQGGRYVPLSEQDVTRWDLRAIAAADRLLLRAAKLRRLGPYQLEAAIQSAHCQSRRGVTVPDTSLLALYDGLLALRPRLGARLGRIGVLGRVEGPGAALDALQSLRSEEPRRLRDHQPWHALRAHFLGKAGRAEEAREAYRRAAALSADPATRDYLFARSTAL